MSTQRDVILLLTVSLGAAASKDARPLSPKEWAKFASWLHEKNLKPESLINADLTVLLSGWIDKKINQLRLEKLLNRGAALGLALEKWSRAGLWVMTRSDHDYPKRLLKRLGKTSPPVLFGCGNKNLLNIGGVSVVGSRNVSDEDGWFAEDVGLFASKSGLGLVSGGARGVDQLAMFGALNASGSVIGVLADSLLTSAMSKKYREYISSGNLVLVSPFNPEARFNVGNAMARNKYIYCLSDNAVVVCSTPNKGGTWNGAIENLNHKWVPLFVKKTNEKSSGNGHLKDLGANWYPDDLENLNSLKESSSSLKKEANTKNTSKVSISEIDLSLYELFLIHVRGLTADKALQVDEISEQLEVSKSQVKLWAKKAIEDKFLLKLTKPVRYKYHTSEPDQSISSPQPLLL